MNETFELMPTKELMCPGRDTHYLHGVVRVDLQFDGGSAADHTWPVLRIVKTRDDGTQETETLFLPAESGKFRLNLYKRVYE